MELLQAIIAGLIGAAIGYGLTTLSLKLFGPTITLILIVSAVCGIVFSGDASAADTVTAAPVTLQDSLVSIISSVQSGVQAGVSFLQQEIPDVIRQLLTWKAVEAGIWATVHGLLFITGCFAFAHGVKVINEQNRLEAEEEAHDKASSKYYDSGDQEARRESVKAYTAAKAAAHGHIMKTIIGCIVGIIWTIVGIVALCNIWGHIMTVAQIYLAPKVWLIEYAASLVK